MTAPALIAVLLWRADRIAPVLIALAALRYPGHAALGLAAWIAVERLRRGKGAQPDDEARLLDRLVAELEGGASPRSALLAVARRSGPIDLSAAGRAIVAGRPARDVARSLAAALPRNGHLVAAAWGLTAEAGAPAGPVMGQLARRAGERGRLDRERRALTAQARATAWLIAGLPLAVCVGLAVTGRIQPGPALPVVLAGVLLELVGLAIVGTMLRRAS